MNNAIVFDFARNENSLIKLQHIWHNTIELHENDKIEIWSGKVNSGALK